MSRLLTLLMKFGPSLACSALWTACCSSLENCSLPNTSRLLIRWLIWKRIENYTRAKLLKLMVMMVTSIDENFICITNFELL